MGESKIIAQGTKWGKTKPLHWNIGEHGKYSILKAIHTMCSHSSYLFKCIFFTLFTYDKMKERCACVCAMREFIYHC